MRRLQYDTDPAAAEPVREMPETTANWAGPHAPTHPNRPVYTVDRPPAADPAAAEPVREMPETTANWAGPHAPTHPNRPVYTVDRPPAAPPDEGDDFPFDAVFCIFTPAHRVDQVVLQIQVPSDVEAALADVQDDRDPTCRERYPLLLPVDPQPCEAYASLIALPTWADEMPVVLCDCRQAGGAMFAVVISPVMRREDLLVVAGLGRGAGVHVYVSYYAWALAPGQAVQLTTGRVVMWRSDFLDDADTPSHPSPTPFLPVGMSEWALSLLQPQPGLCVAFARRASQALHSASLLVSRSLPCHSFQTLLLSAGLPTATAWVAHHEHYLPLANLQIFLIRLRRPHTCGSAHMSGVYGVSQAYTVRHWNTNHLSS
eukprot:s11778_g1.t1